MKKPSKGPKPVKKAGVVPGGPMKPAGSGPAVIPGGVMKRPAPAAAKPAAPRVNPGGPMKRPAAHKKPAAKKKPAPRKLGTVNCVAAACYAATGHWLALDAGDGLHIPAALEALAVLGLITGFAPADLDDDSPGLILGIDLPGPHAVLTVPGGWWSWGDLYHPAVFPDAVIEEAWAVTW